MKLSKRQLKQIIRKSMVETYDGEGRPNWDNEEKLRKAGKFDKSNISKADEEATAAHMKYREDLRKDYERKLAEIEKMKQDRNARKKGERYRFDENKENTMRLSKRQMKRIIREEYSRLKRRGLIKESGSADDYIANMDMGLGFDDAMELAPSPSVLSQAIADVKRFGGYEDIAMAPEEAIQGLIDRSDAIYDLAMEATSGEGYDQSPLSDEWRGFIIGILAAE